MGGGTGTFPKRENILIFGVKKLKF